MIFTNPSGAPELACDECGCRWFDRMTNRCYECGAVVSGESVAEFQAALARFDAAGAEDPVIGSGAGDRRAPPSRQQHR